MKQERRNKMANSMSSSSLSKEAIVTSEKKARWIYWALTAPLILMIGAGGLGLLAGSALNVEGITHLGYPVYLCKILGTAKLLGVIAILYGRFDTLKERAYAGFTFNLLGASARMRFLAIAWERSLRQSSFLASSWLLTGYGRTLLM
jgi:hypothetical protein